LFRLLCSLLVLCLSPLNLGQLGLARSHVLDHIGKLISRSSRHVGQFLYSNVGGSNTEKGSKNDRVECRGLHHLKLLIDIARPVAGFFVVWQ
jgi:hypothetical protein